MMRTSWIILSTVLLTAQVLLAAPGYGQGKEQQLISLQFKNAPVQRVFAAIEAAAGVVIMYENTGVLKNEKITITVKDKKVAEVMDMLLKGRSLQWNIRENIIRVATKTADAGIMAPVISPGSSTPPLEIKGQVFNETGDPMAEVTVTVKGTTLATTTDADGAFALSNVSRDAVLIFSHVSMETLEIKVAGRSNFVIRLQKKVSALNDVTVSLNTGYQQIPKERATGSYVFISKEQLNQRVAPDILSKLEGITNGLAFQKEAYTGNNRLRVRGESTIFANPNPLIVVDNFPYDGDINNINPNDVESITVLKDAAAASIWGVQAGNGVIVITTRKGKLNQPLKIELNANVTTSGKPDLYYPDQISSSDFAGFEQFLFNKGYYDAKLTDPAMPALSAVVEILNKKRNGQLSDAEAMDQIRTISSHDWRNDFLAYLYQRPVVQQYQVNVSSGGQKAAYYLSAGFDKNLSALIGSSNNRFTLNTRSIFRPVNRLELNAGLYYTRSSLVSGSLVGFPNMSPYTRLADDNGNPLTIAQHRAGFEDTITNHGFLDWKYYPLQERNYQSEKSSQNEIRVLTGLKYTILPGLNIEGLYQYQRVFNERSFYNAPKSYLIRDLYNRFAIVSNGNFTGSNYNNQQLGRGLLDLSNGTSESHSGRLTLNYNRTWNEHAVSAIAGWEARQTATKTNSNRLYGYDAATGSFVSPNLFVSYPTYPASGSSPIGSPGNSVSMSGTLNRFRSWFANAGYTFRQRYSVSASARFDGSNYFGVETNQKTVPLWSVGAKWDLHKEKFFMPTQVSSLSLRATYGYNGNLAQNLAAITTVKYAAFPDGYTGMPYASINNVPNPQLRWEKINVLNIGLDFALQNNWLTGSIEYFYKKGDDLIGDAILDPTTGVAQMRGNFSGMRTDGVDLQLNTRNINRAVKWNSTFILNYAVEKVTRFDFKYTSYSFLQYADLQLTPIVGQPLYGLYSYRWAGLDPANGDPRIYLADTINKVFSGTVTSNIKFKDMLYNGRYNPPIFGSLMNNFSWKQFTLNFNIAFKFNYYFRRQSVNYIQLPGGWRNAGSADYANRWQKPGDEAFTNVPSMVYPFNQTRDNFYNVADILVERGDHVRLQFINLAYTVDKRQLRKLPVESIQLYLFANNIGVLWRANDEKIDPDYFANGYPPARSYSIGVRVGF